RIGSAEPPPPRAPGENWLARARVRQYLGLNVSRTVPLGAGREQLTRLLECHLDPGSLALGPRRALAVVRAVVHVRHELPGRRLPRRLYVDMDEGGAIAEACARPFEGLAHRWIVAPVGLTARRSSWASGCALLAAVAEEAMVGLDPLPWTLHERRIGC